MCRYSGDDGDRYNKNERGDDCGVLVMIMMVVIKKKDGNGFVYNSHNTKVIRVMEMVIMINITIILTMIMIVTMIIIIKNSVKTKLIFIISQYFLSLLSLTSFSI